MKPVSLHIFALFCVAFTACGQKDSTKRKEETTETNKFKTLIPAKPQGWVSDFEKLFTPGEIRTLDSLISQHNKDYSNEIAIVTLNLDSTVVRTLDDFKLFSITLFRAWGVGEKNKNNGVGVLISSNRRMVRIAVGYGLENKLTDAEAKRIIDEMMLPNFKTGDYFTGISISLGAIFKEIQ